MYTSTLSQPGRGSLEAVSPPYAGTRVSRQSTTLTPQPRPRRAEASAVSDIQPESRCHARRSAPVADPGHLRRRHSCRDPRPDTESWSGGIRGSALEATGRSTAHVGASARPPRSLPPVLVSRESTRHPYLGPHPAGPPSSIAYVKPARAPARAPPPQPSSQTLELDRRTPSPACGLTASRSGSGVGVANTAASLSTGRCGFHCANGSAAAGRCRRRQLSASLIPVAGGAVSGRCDACPTVGDRRRNDACRPPARIAA
jgi:hypothetical protein